MKKFFLIAAASFALFACSKQDTLQQVKDDEGTKVFYATTEGAGIAGTKVYADSKLRLLWNADDRITVFDRLTLNVQYRFTGEDGANAGEFEKIPYSGFATGNDLDSTFAVYPYLKANKIDNSGTKLTVTIPSSQTFKEHSFGIGSTVMTAVTKEKDDYILLFKHVCGYLRLRLYAASASVSSISIQGNNSEKIAGKGFVNHPVDGFPSITMDASATATITLNCATAVTLDTSSDDYTEFIIAIPPVTFANGFKIVVTDPDGRTFEKTTSKSLEIKRATIESMGALEVVFP